MGSDSGKTNGIQTESTIQSFPATMAFTNGNGNLSNFLKKQNLEVTSNDLQLSVNQVNLKINYFPSVSLSLSNSLCLSVFLSFCLSVFLSFCLSVSLSLCLSVSLSLCLSVPLSLCLSVSLLFYLPVNVSLSLFVLSLLMYAGLNMQHMNLILFFT